MSGGIEWSTSGKFGKNAPAPHVVKSPFLKDVLAGQVALVTGGGSGIGRAVCLALASRSSTLKLVILDLSEQSAKETMNLIDEKYGRGRCAIKKTDVTNLSELEDGLDFAIKTFGSLDIVLNNAGIVFNEDPFITGEKHPKQLPPVVEINVSAVINGTLLAIKKMEKNKEGVIVNTASMAGLIPVPKTPIYAATKTAVVAFTRSMFPLMAPRIRIHAVCPSYTETPMISVVSAEEKKQMAKDVGGILTPEKVAEAMVLLCIGQDKGPIARVTVRGGIEFLPEGSQKKAPSKL